MISICIPIYNFKVDRLINSLIEQVNALNTTAEIILIDDCSNEITRAENKEIVNREGVRFFQLEENIGRSAIRNLFLKHAHQEYLLFLDCDSLIIGPDFLKTYINSIETNPKAVICGGRVYPQDKMPRNHRLRWKYGIKREQQTAAERKKNPYASFMTNNFVVPKAILQSTQFDEQLSGYGHEDTLFGFELKKKQIEILHIDNVILNGEIESNADYLKNTENAIVNLVVILKLINGEESFIEDVSLLRVYFNNKSLHWLIGLVFFLFKPLIRFSLLKGCIHLRIFDFYKLGYLNSIYQQD